MSLTIHSRLLRAGASGQKRGRTRNGGYWNPSTRTRPAAVGSPGRPAPAVRNTQRLPPRSARAVNPGASILAWG